MQSGNKESFLNLSQKSVIILFFTLILFSAIAFKNLVFQPNFLLKKFKVFLNILKIYPNSLYRKFFKKHYLLQNLTSVNNL